MRRRANARAGARVAAAVESPSCKSYGRERESPSCKSYGRERETELQKLMSESVRARVQKLMSESENPSCKNGGDAGKITCQFGGCCCLSKAHFVSLMSSTWRHISGWQTHSMQIPEITVNATPESRRRIILAHTAMASAHAFADLVGSKVTCNTGVTSYGSIRFQFYNFLFSSNPDVQKRSKCGNIFIISSLIENVRNIVEQFFEIWPLFSKIKPEGISFLNQRMSTSLETPPKLLRRRFARPISHSVLFPKTPWHGAKMGRRLVIVL
jgi:hypothetical protein